jgi:hypothetical protein
MVQASPESSTFQAKCPVFVHEDWIEWILILNKMDKTNRTLLIAFNAILIFLTIFLNLLSVITIRKSSQLKNKMCYFVILVQSVVDFGVGILGIPSFIVYLSTPLLRIQNCLVVVVLFQLITVILLLSNATLTVMTVERYIGVLHPYSYQTLVTKGRIVTFLSVFALTSIIINILSIYIPTEVMRSIDVFLITNFLFIVYAYTRIYFVIRKLVRSEREPADIAKKHTKKRRLLQEIKYAKSCFIVVLCYAVSLLSVVANPFYGDVESAQNVAHYHWIITLFNFNSSLNSIIFFWNKTMLRKEASVVLKSILSRLH